MSFLCLRFVCCALLALPLIASICVALIKRKRMREVRPAVGFAQTSNTNQYGAVLTNGSANQSKECSGAPDATQTRNQNAENVQHGISKSKYTQRDIQILFLASIANMYPDLTHFNWFFFSPFPRIISPFSPLLSSYSPLSAVLSCLQALSVQNCSQGLLASESSGNSYSSLNGIRILSLLWIISGHTVQLSAWSNLGESEGEISVSTHYLTMFRLCLSPDFISFTWFVSM